MKFPQIKGETATAQFDEWFNYYQTVAIGDKLIKSVLSEGKLIKCPNISKPEFIVTNIKRTGLFGYKKLVTIERL